MAVFERATLGACARVSALEEYGAHEAVKLALRQMFIARELHSLALGLLLRLLKEQASGTKLSAV